MRWGQTLLSGWSHPTCRGIVGVGNVAGHRYRSFPGDSLGYLNGLVCTQGVLAVTAACLAVRRNVFEQAGGFDERLRVAYNDVDFCLKVMPWVIATSSPPGLNSFTTKAAAGVSKIPPRSRSGSKKKWNTWLSRWSHVLFNDPYYNPNLTLTGEDYALTHPLATVPPESLGTVSQCSRVNKSGGWPLRIQNLPRSALL